MFVWSDTLRNWKGDKVITPQSLRDEHGPFLTLTPASAMLLSDKELSAYGIKRIKSDDLVSYAAKKRREKLAGSTKMEIGDKIIELWVDPESRSSLTAATIAALLNPDHVVRWKGSNGVFYELDAAEIVALGVSVMSYVQGLFDKEAEVIAGIEAGTLTDFEQIDARFG